MQPIRFAPLSVPPGEVVVVPQPAPTTGSFADRIGAALASANQEQLAAEQAAGQLASGEIDSVDAVLALSKADLTLRHIVTLRNRLLETFQDVMRMPV